MDPRLRAGRREVVAGVEVREDLARGRLSERAILTPRRSCNRCDISTLRWKTQWCYNPPTKAKLKVGLMKFAARMNRLSGEGAFEVLAKVNALREQGRDMISFCIGEPDFPTPAHICEAGIQAIRDGHTKYVPSGGLPELREAVARYVSHLRQVDIKAKNVIIAPGVKPALLAGVLAVVEEGDEVLYPNPGFPAYRSHIEFVGATAVPVPLREEKQFRLDVADLEQRVTDKTKMIILNSPQNPTGGILTQEDLEAISEVAKSRDLWVLSDEIYAQISYDGLVPSLLSIPGMMERTFYVDGYSKYYSMTGWRLGYVICNEEIASLLPTLMVNLISCTAAFTQQAGIVALESSQEPSERMVEEFRLRRDLIVAGLNDIDGVTCQTPRGAFYVYPNVTGACRKLGLPDSLAFQNYLLEQANVAVLARDCFGPKNPGEDQEYVRFSYATAADQIQEGLRRIKGAVEQ